jgi:hypothetical protein
MLHQKQQQQQQQATTRNNHPQVSTNRPRDDRETIGVINLLLRTPPDAVVAGTAAI